MSETQFDVVIVGGRCAGATLGAMLARGGLRVCVLDKASFPARRSRHARSNPTGWRCCAGSGYSRRCWPRARTWYGEPPSPARTRNSRWTSTRMPTVRCWVCAARPWTRSSSTTPRAPARRSAPAARWRR
ncbi:FAD-dependent monooxygenase [Nocardia otitidiscaviarum]|nr:FAD-dependent monooxygenase [Nocardia otitidiscaviarum]